MWRSFFWAVGIFLLILGFETLVVDQFVLTDSRRLPRIVSPNQYPSQNFGNTVNYLPAGYQTANNPGFNRVVQTKDWMPWSLLAAGAITVMYTSSLVTRSGGGSD